MYGFSNVTPTSGKAISTADAKTHCSIDLAENAHDRKIDALVRAAVLMFQRETGYQLLTSVDDYVIDKFPDNGCDIPIPRYPLASVASVKYQDGDDAEQTLTSTKYIVGITRTPPLISLDAAESAWPDTAQESEAVTIQMTTGYGTAADIPDDIQTCLLMMVSHWFENREASSEKRLTDIPLGAVSLMQSYAVGDAFLEYGI